MESRAAQGVLLAMAVRALLPSAFYSIGAPDIQRFAAHYRDRRFPVNASTPPSRATPHDPGRLWAAFLQRTSFRSIHPPASRAQRWGNQLFGATAASVTAEAVSARMMQDRLIGRCSRPMRMAVKHCAGLDVSMSIYVVDDTRKVVREGEVGSEPRRSRPGYPRLVLLRAGRSRGWLAWAGNVRRAHTVVGLPLV